MRSSAEHTGAFAPHVLRLWGRRQNLLPGTVLVVLAVAGWIYTLYRASAMSGTEDDIGGPAVFLFGWTTMMVAMMVPATLPLILLYRTVTRERLSPARARIGTAALLAGYVVVWAVAGLPDYAYHLATMGVSRGVVAAVPAMLLTAGGAYQFTVLKRGCHTRCSNPLFFLMQKWKPGTVGALCLGLLHGLDCLGCCLGLMVGLVALGMMNGPTCPLS